MLGKVGSTGEGNKGEQGSQRKDWKEEEPGVEIRWDDGKWGAVYQSGRVAQRTERMGWLGTG